jgi:hypothetical protein
MLLILNYFPRLKIGVTRWRRLGLVKEENFPWMYIMENRKVCSDVLTRFGIPSDANRQVCSDASTRYTMVFDPTLVSLSRGNPTSHSSPIPSRNKSYSIRTKPLPEYASSVPIIMNTPSRPSERSSSVRVQSDPHSS